MKGKALALSLTTLMALSSFNFAAVPQTKTGVTLSGIVNQPNWFGHEQLVVKSETDSGFAYYQLGLDGQSKLLLQASVNATEVSEHESGSLLAYVNDNGELYLQDLKAQSIKKISIDNEPKMELQFSNDGSKLYFLMGEKIDQIVVIDLASGKQTVLLADKVAYKSDLQISADGTKALYAVTKAGTVNDKDESFAVDAKGTEPQLHMVDLTAAAPKSVQLTTSLDNKVFPKFTQDNKIVYVSAYADKDGMSLMQMNSDGSGLKTLVNHLEVSQVLVLNDGTLLVVGENASFKKSLFKVAANGSTQKIVTLPASTMEVQAKDLGHIAVTIATESGEKISTLLNGKFTDLTK